MNSFKVKFVNPQNVIGGGGANLYRLATNQYHSLKVFIYEYM